MAEFESVDIRRRPSVQPRHHHATIRLETNAPQPSLCLKPPSSVNKRVGRMLQNIFTFKALMDTLTLLLNTPMVPPEENPEQKEIPLTELSVSSRNSVGSNIF